MKFGIKTLDDFKVKDKTVLLRVDINEPVDKETDTLKDITRIKASVKTIGELAGQGAKVVILAHQGSDIEYQNFHTTRPHAKVLSELLQKDVQFVDDVCGPAARQAIKDLKSGDVLLLDNVRFVSEEQTLFELSLRLGGEEQSKTLVVRTLAPLADLYVCDAFAAAHRDQPTLCGFEQVLPSAMGRLFEEEFCVLSKLMKSPEPPCVFVLGGAKISDAFLMMKTVLKANIADSILTGGLVAHVMLLAQGTDIGKPTRDYILAKGFGDYIEAAEELLENYADRIILPDDLAFSADGARTEIAIDSGVTTLQTEAFTDIGERTAKRYAQMIRQAKTVFVNGPVGVFEKQATEKGTKMIWDALAETDAYTVIGGGDSITATNRYGYADKISYICTGGGALIRFLSGEELPVVSALRNGAKDSNH